MIVFMTARGRAARARRMQSREKKSTGDSSCNRRRHNWLRGGRRLVVYHCSVGKAMMRAAPMIQTMLGEGLQLLILSLLDICNATG